MTKDYQAALSRTKFSDFGGLLAHHVMTSFCHSHPLNLCIKAGEIGSTFDQLEKHMPYISDICPTPNAM